MNFQVFRTILMKLLDLFRSYKISCYLEDFSSLNILQWYNSFFITHARFQSFFMPMKRD